MVPVKFPEATKNLLKPTSMADEECKSLWVFNDGQICVSRWRRLSFTDRLRILFYGHIWLTVHSGQTQPPVRLDSTKTVFESSAQFDAEPIREGAKKFA